MGRTEGASGSAGMRLIQDYAASAEAVTVDSEIMRLLQKVWPWNSSVSWFSRMSNCGAGLSMKMDREIQNICVNPLERCRDFKCKSLFADEHTPRIIIYH